MNYIVEINNLSKDYEKGFLKKKRMRALDGLTLNVEPHQIFGFLGGNGAGKSTTIKLLMRIVFPTEGSAKVLGVDISSTAMHAKIGYCPENPYFYDYLKPLELLDYFGSLQGLNVTTRRARAKELLQRVGLDEAAWNRQLRKFSKGMLQRVGIAQSLLGDPEIVFLDEPMSGLDPIGRRDIRELIAELRKNGKTVFMSSHILSDIEALCDNVAILRKGKLVAQGNLEDLLTKTGETQKFELYFTGIDEERLVATLRNFNVSNISAKANGATAELADETKISAAIDAVTNNGGRIVSVQPVKLALEEFFTETRPTEQESIEA
ncbi:MAG: ABC transporter ATP-binding protein [Pyrinomonadaceae bacterium]